jgi:hypothetical protein
MVTAASCEMRLFALLGVLLPPVPVSCNVHLRSVAFALQKLVVLES